MRITWGIGILFALSGSAIGVAAQGLTLDSLIQSGLRNNPELLVTREEGKVAAADTVSATLGRNPELAFEVEHNLTDPARPKGNVRLSREFQPGVLKGQYQASKAGWEAQKQSGKAREIEIAAEIRSSFFEWQILTRKQRLQAEVGKRWESLSRIASAKVKEGRLSQVEEAQAQLNLAKVRQKESELRTERESIGKQLGYLTGRNLASDSIATLEIDSLPAYVSEDSLVAWALLENPELKALDKEIDARKLQIKLDEALRTPPVTVSLGYDRESSGENLVGGGISLPLPFFNRNQSGIAKSRAALGLAQSRRAATEQRFKSEIGQMSARLESLGMRYQAYQREVKPLTRKQLDLSEKGFLQGLLGIFDLSRVQEEYLGQEMEALDVLGAYYELWNRLGKVAGGKTW